jgi:hypothetical protein
MIEKYSSPGELSIGLVNEILDVIGQYSEAMLLPTALGCLELAKAQLIENHLAGDDEDEEDDE